MRKKTCFQNIVYYLEMVPKKVNDGFFHANLIQKNKKIINNKAKTCTCMFVNMKKWKLAWCTTSTIPYEELFRYMVYYR